MRVGQAKAAGVDCIEAGPQIFKLIFPAGLKAAEGMPAPYFWYHGVRVCPLGKSDEILEHESVSLEERLHGTGDGVVETYK